MSTYSIANLTLHYYFVYEFGPYIFGLFSHLQFTDNFDRIRLHRIDNQSSMLG